jgi:predicted RNA-binding protein with TRAM domain
MTDTPSPVPTSDAKWRAIALVCLPIVGILLVILAISLIRPRDSRVVVYHYEDGLHGAPSVNRGHVTDATAPANARITPLLGYRYRVFVEDESDDRSSGIARIGGRTTFIPDARRGQTAIVDVTRVRPNVVDAILVRVVSETVLPPKPAREPYKPAPTDAAAMVVDNAEFDVLVTEPSSKNPDSECIARVAGLVVVVDQPLPVGERVNIRVTERRERIAFATPTGKPAGKAPLAPTSAPRRDRAPRAATPASGPAAGPVVVPATAPVAASPVPDRILPGEEYDVVILEPSKKNPDTESVAKIDGLVVFVRNPPPPGTACRVRILERRPRNAVAEVVPVPISKPAPKPAPKPVSP